MTIVKPSLEAGPGRDMIMYIPAKREDLPDMPMEMKMSGKMKKYF